MPEDFTEEERAKADTFAAEHGKPQLIPTGFEWICPHCQSYNRGVEKEPYRRCWQCNAPVSVAIPE